MMTLAETRVALLIIDRYPETIAWEDFGDLGNETGRLDVLPPSQVAKNAISYAQVKTVMMKYSALHRSLSKSIAEEIGCKYVTYDWLTKALSRLLEDTTFASFCQMVNCSIFVKKRMKERRLTRISALDEVL